MKSMKLSIINTIPPRVFYSVGIIGGMIGVLSFILILLPFGGLMMDLSFLSTNLLWVVWPLVQSIGFLGIPDEKRNQTAVACFGLHQFVCVSSLILLIASTTTIYQDIFLGAIYLTVISMARVLGIVLMTISLGIVLYNLHKS